MITYTKVRNDFIERRDLTAVEKLILQYLHGRLGSWEINPDQIRSALNLGHDATDKALSRLKRKGWLEGHGRDERGYFRRSTLVTSRRSEVIAPDVSAGQSVPGNPGREVPGGISRPGKPGSNKGLSMKDSHEVRSNEGPSEDPWRDWRPAA